MYYQNEEPRYHRYFIIEFFFQTLTEIFLRAAEEGMVSKESAKRIVELLKSRDF